MAGNKASSSEAEQRSLWSAERWLGFAPPPPFPHRLGYFLIFAEGSPTPGSTLRCKERTWDAGSCCGSAIVRHTDDIAYLRAVLDDLLHGGSEEAGLPVDKRRVFVSG